MNCARLKNHFSRRWYINMQRRTRIFIFVSIIFCFLLSGCITNPEPQDSKRWSDKDSIIAVLEDSYIAADYESRLMGEYSVYRYYPTENRSEDIGSVPNFMMTYGRPVLIDNSLYMFISSADDTSVAEHLYKIDLSTNKIASLYRHPDNYPLSPVASVSGNLIFLGVNQNSDSSITSRLYYQDLSGSEYSCVYEKEYGADGTGEAMVHLSASGDKIYVLTRVSDSNSQSYAVDIFDDSFNHTKRLFLGDEFGDIASNQKLTKFEVVGDYIFLRTTSTGFIGYLGEDDVEVIMSHDLLDMAYNPSYDYQNECIFYLMREAEWYSLDLLNGELSKLPWNYGSDRVIKYVDASNSGYLLKHYIDDNGNITKSELVFIPKS